MKSAVPAEETTALQWMNSFAAQRTKYLRFAQMQVPVFASRLAPCLLRRGSGLTPSARQYQCALLAPNYNTS
jgi:hypothetical protein